MSMNASPGWDQLLNAQHFKECKNKND
ncbi:hypothetical protein ACMD2_26673, partial [Ananas comosus]